MSSLKKDSFDNVKSYYNYIKQWYKVNTEEDFTCSREGGDDHMPVSLIFYLKVLSHLILISKINYLSLKDSTHY